MPTTTTVDLGPCACCGAPTALQCGGTCFGYTPPATLYATPVNIQNAPALITTSVELTYVVNGSWPNGTTATGWRGEWVFTNGGRLTFFFSPVVCPCCMIGRFGTYPGEFVGDGAAINLDFIECAPLHAKYHTYFGSQILCEGVNGGGAGGPSGFDEVRRNGGWWEVEITE